MKIYSHSILISFVAQHHTKLIHTLFIIFCSTTKHTNLFILYVDILCCTIITTKYKLILTPFNLFCCTTIHTNSFLLNFNLFCCTTIHKNPFLLFLDINCRTTTHETYFHSILISFVSLKYI